MLLLLACHSDPLDSVSTLAPSADGWTLGAEESCTAPQPAQWQLDPLFETYTTPAPEVHNGLNPGALALLGEPDNWNLYWTQPDGVGSRFLKTTDILFHDELYIPQAFAQADLDADGQTDLLMTLGAIAVVWGGQDLQPLGTRRDNAGPTDIAPGDIDKDGDLDVLVAWSAPDHSNPSLMRGEILRNDGNRQFTSLAFDAPDDVWGPGFDFTIRDINQDGNQDAYLCNDMGAEVAPNRLFLGDGTTLVPHSGEGLDQRLSCMGTSWGDIDGDGTLELYIAESVHHLLMKSDDAGNWYDIANSMGLSTTPFGPHTMSWGSTIADFDNDTQMELVDGIGDFWTLDQEPNAPVWFERDSDGQFQDISQSRGLPTAANARGILAQDINRDGLLDLIMGDANRSPWIFLSAGCSEDNWMEISAPIGSEVKIEAGDHIFAARIDTESGWASSGPATAHIGLGSLQSVDRVILTLSNGDERVLEGPLSTRRRLLFQE